MTLCDTGPLLALIDKRDPDHLRCAATLRSVSTPLVTSWPCITEAMHIRGERGGWFFQRELWTLWEQKVLTLRSLPEHDEQRLLDLMDKYQDTPMDLGDASLVALAERMRTRRIFTLDSDFRIYRTADGKAFEIIPE